MTIRSKKTRCALRSLEKISGSKLTLGRLLWAIRTGDEITQVDFANQLENMSRQQLCDIEHGRKLVSPQLAAKYARILGYPEQQFIQLSLQDIVDRAGLEVRVDVSRSLYSSGLMGNVG